MKLKIKQLNKVNLITLLTVVLAVIFTTSKLSANEDTQYFTTDLLSQNTIQDSYTLAGLMENKIGKEEARITRQKRIDSLLKLLKSVGSPVATEHYAAYIIDLSVSVNADYRVIVAIMGTESGYCKHPLGYNCFGYLNGVKYASFDDAFSRLIPKIGKQYVIKYGWNFEGFTKAYGQLGEHAAGNMYSIAIKLYY
jgi:hypothetical protein